MYQTKTDVNLKEAAYKIIKDKILRCEYMPNDILSEIILMREIDASRTPIREALNMLSREGFVRIIPKKGILVEPLTIRDVNMTFDARLLLEPYIVENFCDGIDRERLLKLKEEILTLMDRDTFNPEEAARYCDTDDRLHRTIIAACSNKYLNLSLEHIYDQNMRIRILGGKNIWQRHKTAGQEHLELIEYILRGDVASAAASVRLHLIHSRDAAIASFLK